jgi:hypothetical protein
MCGEKRKKKKSEGKMFATYENFSGVKKPPDDL